MRSASGHNIPGVGMGNSGQQPQGMIKEISTVGSASATGSVGGKTTWAEQSEMDYDADKMSEDQDIGDGTSSIGGASDEMDKASLVAFGEGAGSMISGPVNTANARLIAARSGAGAGLRSQSYLSSTGAISGSGGSMPMSGVETGRERPVSHSSTGAAFGGDHKMMDGVTFDQDALDSTIATPPAVEHGMGRFSGSGAEIAENVMRDRLNDEDMRGMQTPPDNQSLGRFGFERE